MFSPLLLLFHELVFKRARSPVNYVTVFHYETLGNTWGNCRCLVTVGGSNPYSRWEWLIHAKEILISGAQNKQPITAQDKHTNGTHKMWSNDGNHKMWSNDGNHKMWSNDGTHKMWSNDGTHKMWSNDGTHKMWSNDGTHKMWSNEGFISEDQICQWEFDTRILCYYLHVNRTKLLTATAEATQRRNSAPI